MVDLDKLLNMPRAAKGCELQRGAIAEPDDGRLPGVGILRCREITKACQLPHYRGDYETAAENTGHLWRFTRSSQSRWASTSRSHHSGSGLGLR